MKLNNFFTEKLTRQVADPANPAATDPTPQTQDLAAPDLSFIPGDYQTDGKPDIGKFTAHYQDLVARDAQYAERQAQIPESYEFATTADLKFDGLDLPEGFSVELAKDDPAMAPLYEQLGGFLKEIGAPASAAGKVSDMIARYEATKASKFYAAQKAEMAALGTPAQQQARLGAIDRALQSRLPAAQAEAIKAAVSAVSTAATVQALEALLRPTGHTAPPNSPSRPDLDAMTPMERLKYANSQTKT